MDLVVYFPSLSLNAAVLVSARFFIASLEWLHMSATSDSAVKPATFCQWEVEVSASVDFLFALKPSLAHPAAILDQEGQMSRALSGLNCF